jgi:guanine deaminase
MTAGQKLKLFTGAFVHSINLNSLEIIPKATIGVSEDGTIVFIDKSSKTPLEAAKLHGVGESEISIVTTTSSSSFFFPGFFDTHIHASQYPNNGIFGKSTLLDWLETYTFPLESSFKDLNKAKSIYSKVIERTLSHGTTTASYYATIHPEATNILADLAFSKGQRAFVGRVCMNQNSPDFYKDATEEQSRKADLQVIEHIKTIDPEYKRVSPIFTPRFAPTCTHDSMKWMGDMMKKTGLPCQTHISENKAEIEWVKHLFPNNKSYTDVYDAAGILTEKTILAHAIHLSEEEIETIKARNSGISHCPISNSSITSGEAPIRKYLDKDLKVSLGTDCSGGFSPSILESARHALLVSRHFTMDSENDKDKLSIAEVLFLATLGGARVCNLEDSLGNFEVGKKWDAQLVDLESKDSGIDIFEWQTIDSSSDEENIVKFENLVAKWLFNGDDRNTVSVWVDGNLVSSRL